MTPITIQELQSLGAIYLANIQNGFDQYCTETKILNQNEAFAYFSKLCTQYNFENCYVDFYYYTLTDHEREQLHTVLTPQEINFLQKNSPTLQSNADELIFPITNTLLEIVCKLNATSMLFSTIYFTKAPHTYWGNYNHEYIHFYND